MTRILTIAFLFFSIGAQAAEVVPTTSDGTILNTGISYTVVSNGSPRQIWAPGASDSGLWFWLNNFPEFLSISTQTMTVTFSEPVPLNQFTLGVNSISNGEFTLTITGGTATLTDFNLADGIDDVGGSGPANFDPQTGIFDADSSDRSLMIGSTSSNTITSFTLSGNNSPDGYTLFFATAGDSLFSDGFEIIVGR